MRKYLLIAASFIFTFSFATTKIISTSGTSFSPTNTTIAPGDTIVFNVSSGHTATEVTQATWNINGTTPNGGFNFGAGTNQQVTGLSLGTYYFVCQNHADMGMKGTITVDMTSGVKGKITDNDLFILFPNPAKDFLLLKSTGILFEKIRIVSIDGKFSKEILLTANTDKVSIADLPKASYILSAYAKENVVYARKFVKE